MKIRARNILKGNVKGIINGPLSTEVTVRLSDGEEIVSIITRASAQNLELKDTYDLIRS